MNLKLKLLLQMVNNLSRPAKDARRDLKGIKTEADTLKNVSTGNKLASDIEKIGIKAKAARRDLLAMGAAAKQAAAGARRDARGRFVGANGKAPAEKTSPDGAGSGTVVAGGGRKIIGGIVGYYAARESARRTVGAAVDFEKEMADVKKKVDLPDNQKWSDLENAITGSSLKFGKTRAEVARLTAELGASGIAYGDLAQYIDLATKAGSAWDMTANEAGQKLMKVKAGMNYNFGQMSDYVDKVNALSDAGASKERDVVEMASRSFAAAKASGVSEDTSLAFLTGMNSAGIEAEVASRGFNAMVSKLRTAKTAGSKDMAEGLKLIGTTATDVEKGMKTNAEQTLRMVMDKFGKAKDQAAAGVKIFGREWWDEFARMAQASQEILRYLDKLRDPSQWKGSAQKNVNIELATTANHMERLKTLAEVVGERLGKWALPPINDAIEKLLAMMRQVDAETEKSRRAAEIIKKAEGGKGLTAEDRDQVANDTELAREVQRGTARGAMQRDSDATARDDKNRTGPEADAERQKLLRRNLERQIQVLESDLAHSDPMGNLKSGKGRQLQRLKNQRDLLPDGPRTDKPGNIPADQKREARDWNLKLVTAVLDQTERRVANLMRLAAAMPGDRSLDKDLVDAEASATRTRARAKAANSGEVKPFGFGAGNKQMPDGTGGQAKSMNFDFGKNMLAKLQPEMQADGALIFERLRQGMESQKGAIEGTANATKSAIEQPFKGMDLSSEGQAAMASLANGIKAGEGQAIAAANQVKANVMRALSGISAGSGGSVRSKLSGGLHDGGVAP